MNADGHIALQSTVLYRKRAHCGPLPSCWAPPSKLDKFELVGRTTSLENRKAREQEGALLERWVSQGCEVGEQSNGS